jgi:hypothetical protein
MRYPRPRNSTHPLVLIHHAEGSLNGNDGYSLLSQRDGGVGQFCVSKSYQACRCSTLINQNALRLLARHRYAVFGKRIALKPNVTS